MIADALRLWYGAKVKLHHTTGVPDWLQQKPASRNYWQRLAATTSGVITPANVASFLGLVIVFYGISLLRTHEFALAALVVAVGRGFDVVDGFVAEHTGTKSPLGEAVDAVCDKLGTIAVLTAVGVEHIVPWWVVIVVALHHAVNSIVAYISWRRKLAMRPTLAGKLATALEWLALCAFMVAAMHVSHWLWVAYMLLAPALWLGIVASIGYVRLLRTSSSAATVADDNNRRT